MRIAHNLAALNAASQYQLREKKINKTLEKLSTGYRINRSADDASGLAVSEKIRAQITGLNQDIQNAMDGLNFLRTGEGAMEELHALLRRCYELAEQSRNSLHDETDRNALNEEFQELVKEIDRICTTSNYNGVPHFPNEHNLPAKTITITTVITRPIPTGTPPAVPPGSPVAEGEEEADPTEQVVHIIETQFSASSGVIDVDPCLIKIGTPEVEDSYFELPQFVLCAHTLGIDEKDISTIDGAQDVSREIPYMIDILSGMRAIYGAKFNTLEHSIAHSQIHAENLQDMESTIRDADMAEEMTEFTRNNILQESTKAMLAQANSQPESVLRLLQ